MVLKIMSCNCLYLQFVRENVEQVEEAVVNIWYLFVREERENEPAKAVLQHTVSLDDFLWSITTVFAENSADDNWIWQYEHELHGDL